MGGVTREPAAPLPEALRQSVFESDISAPIEFVHTVLEPRRSYLNKLLHVLLCEDINGRLHNPYVCSVFRGEFSEVVWLDQLKAPTVSSLSEWPQHVRGVFVQGDSHLVAQSRIGLELIHRKQFRIRSEERRVGKQHRSRV